MKCDGLPDPVCVRELNTYLSLWKEDDTREDIDQVMFIYYKINEMVYGIIISYRSSKSESNKYFVNIIYRF